MLIDKLDIVEKRYKEIYQLIGDPEIISNQKKYIELNKELKDLKKLVDKGNDYTDLFPLVNEKVKGIICLGVDNAKLLNTFSGMVETIIETQSITEAVKIAYKLSDKGDNVLLSPACASFDLFENYEDRGRQFKEAVRNL